LPDLKKNRSSVRGSSAVVLSVDVGMDLWEISAFAEFVFESLPTKGGFPV
jgi:hypothetical protein